MSLKVIEKKDIVGITTGSEDTLDSFIDIWVADDITDSIFKTNDDARQFAEMIVKLLEAVHDFE